MMLKEGVLTIYYKGNQYRDKEALSYAQSVRPHIHEIDIIQDNITPTQLQELAVYLGVPIEELVDKKNDLYVAQYQDKSFDDMGWLTVLVENPEMIKTPIVFLDKKGKILESARDIIKFGASEKGGAA